MFELCGGQKIVDELRDKIINKQDLNSLDLTQHLDVTLVTYPMESWKEIIEKKVTEHVANIFPENDARTYILAHLKTQQNSENHQN
jgi:hypothetical protein